MKFSKLTMGLAAVGVVSLASAARADETPMNQVQTALSNTTLSGYVDTAATWRPGTDKVAGGGTGPNGNIPLYSFAKNDGFSLNAVDIALDKPLDESPWAAGYHVEMMFGPDAVPTTGIYETSVGFGNIRQAYLALRTPVGQSGIDWKVGLFDTIIGYESTSSPLDPNYTRSYGYSIEPTTHAGVVGTYKVNDMISVTAGVANSWNADLQQNSINGTTGYESQKTYMGAVTLTAPDSMGFLKGATLTGGVINAVDTHRSNRDTATSWYAGATVPTPLNALKLGAALDYLALHNGMGEAWVIGGYASYQINDKASFNLRAEYGQDDTGLLYGSNNSFGNNNILTPNRDAFEEITATLQYNLWANVISRLEFRWDHVEHGSAFGVVQSGEFAGSPNRANDFLLAANLIYQF